MFPRDEKLNIKEDDDAEANQMENYFSGFKTCSNVFQLWRWKIDAGAMAMAGTVRGACSYLSQHSTF